MELKLSMAIMQVTTSGDNVVLSVAGMLVAISVAVRTFCNTCAGDSFGSKYVGENIYCNYADGVSVANMQVVFSAVNYAHNSFCCNYAGVCFFIIT